MTIRSACGGTERDDATPKVAYGFSHSNSNTSLQTKPSKECGMTLRSVPTGEGAAIIDNDLSQMRYIVRRLTPTEAERLMGLPDGYTIPRGLKVTDELVADFQRIHDTFGAIMAEYEHKPAPKPKSASQVRAWLEKITDPDTCPDSPRYRVCGNGWATNQPRWILTRLLALGEGVDPFTGEEAAPCS